MGWECRLYIGKFNEYYRKYVPDIVALLYSEQNYQFVDDEDEPKACFRATAKECIERLNELGYTWDLLVGFYADIRFNGYAAGMFLGQSMRAGENTEYLVSKFKSNQPEQDLTSLINFYRQFTREKNDIWVDELPGKAEYHFPVHDHLGVLSEMADTIRETEEASINMDDWLALRAADSLLYLHHDNPLMEWVFFTRILLSVVDEHEEVYFDLSDAIAEISETDTDLENIGRDYLKNAMGSLATHAKLLGRMFSMFADLDNKLGRHYFLGRASTLLNLVESQKGTAQERGRYLEDLVEALVKMDHQLVVVKKNLANDTEELDLVLSNQIDNPFWIAMQSPLIFVECKNWSNPVGASEARVFESKLRERGNLCRVGIFVAMKGFTSPFKDVIKRTQSQGHIVFIITGDDIRDMLSQQSSLSEWLLAHGALKVM